MSNKSTTKIYLKNYNIKNINQSQIDKIKNKFKYTTTYKKVILSNIGIFKLKNDRVFKLSRKQRIFENEDFILVHETNKENEFFQIPYNHKEILIKKINIQINKNTNIIFEYLDNILHDLYILENGKKDINDYVLNNEISLVRKMLI